MPKQIDEAKLRAFRLFENASSETLAYALREGRTRRVERHGRVDLDGGELILLLSGSLRVEKNHALLTTLRAGDMTGVATLFSQTSLQSDVVAVQPAVLFMLSRESLFAMLSSDGELLRSYLGFLGDRICFLNQNKIERKGKCY